MATKTTSKATARKASAKKATKNGWKTCSRGHHFRGTYCATCWPGRETSAAKKRRR